MNQTRQKEKVSNSFKAPTEKGLTTHSSQGATFIRKKPLPIKELKEEYEDVTTR